MNADRIMLNIEGAIAKGRRLAREEIALDNLREAVELLDGVIAAYIELGNDNMTCELDELAHQLQSLAKREAERCLAVNEREPEEYKRKYTVEPSNNIFQRGGY